MPKIAGRNRSCDPTVRSELDLHCSTMCHDRCNVRSRTVTLILHRCGTSLLEVLLAIVILAGGLTALTQQSFVAANVSRRLELETEASLRCRRRLNEALMEDRSSDGDCTGQFEDDPSWQWSIQQDTTGFPNTIQITVKVWQSGNNQQDSACRLQRLLTSAAPFEKTDSIRRTLSRRR